MSTAKVSREFDVLSSVYDATRQPLDPLTIQNLYAFLTEHHWNEILEVGVGTGRISRPLVDLGARAVGVDASRGMLARAAAKGLRRLVRGSATRLPFADRSFDATLFVHVLHILEQPDLGLREASRVSRGGVLAVLDLPPSDGGGPGSGRGEPRQIVRQLLAEAGYPDLIRGGPRAKEQELLRTHPPKELRVLSDREITEPLTKALDVLEKRGYRHLLHIPPEVLLSAVATARERLGDRTVTFRRTEAVAWWVPETSPGTS